MTADDIRLLKDTESVIALFRRSLPQPVAEVDVEPQHRRFRAQQNLHLAKYAATALPVPTPSSLDVAIRDVFSHPRIGSCWIEPTDLVENSSGGIDTPAEPAALMLITDILKMDDPASGEIYRLGRLLVKIPAKWAIIHAQPLLNSRHPYMRNGRLELSPIHGQLAELHAQGDFFGLVSLLINYLETPNLGWPDLHTALQPEPFVEDDDFLAEEVEPAEPESRSPIRRFVNALRLGLRQGWKKFQRTSDPDSQT